MRRVRTGRQKRWLIGGLQLCVLLLAPVLGARLVERDSAYTQAKGTAAEDIAKCLKYRTPPKPRFAQTMADPTKPPGEQQQQQQQKKQQKQPQNPLMPDDDEAGVDGTQPGAATGGGLILGAPLPSGPGGTLIGTDLAQTLAAFTPPTLNVPPKSKECKSPSKEYSGFCLDAAMCTGATFNHVGCPEGTYCCSAEKTATKPTPMYVPRKPFDMIFTNVKEPRKTAMWYYFNEALAGVVKPTYDKRQRCIVISCFIGQVSVESGGLKYFEEIADGSEYEWNKDLGNTQPGDGPRFRGRGPIQLTGRTNYQAYSDASGVDVVNHPDSVCFPLRGWKTTVWYWNSRFVSDACLRGDFQEATCLINGAANGMYTNLKGRWAAYVAAKKELGC